MEREEVPESVVVIRSRMLYTLGACILGRVVTQSGPFNKIPYLHVFAGTLVL